MPAGTYWELGPGEGGCHSSALCLGGSGFSDASLCTLEAPRVTRRHLMAGPRPRDAKARLPFGLPHLRGGNCSPKGTLSPSAPPRRVRFLAAGRCVPGPHSRGSLRVGPGKEGSIGVPALLPPLRLRTAEQSKPARPTQPIQRASAQANTHAQSR